MRRKLGPDMPKYVLRFAGICAVLTILQKGLLSTGLGGGTPLFGVGLAFLIPFLAASDVGAALMRRIGGRPSSALGLSVTLTATYMALHELLSVLFHEMPVILAAQEDGRDGFLMLGFVVAALAAAVRLGLAFGARLGTVTETVGASTVRRTAFAFGEGRTTARGLVFRFLVVCLAMTAIQGFVTVVFGMRSPVLAFGVPVMAGALAAGDHAARTAGVQLQGTQAWLVAVMGATLHTAVQFLLMRIAAPFGWLGSFDVSDPQVMVAFAPVAIAIAAVLARVCLSLGAKAGAARRLSERAPG